MKKYFRIHKKNEEGITLLEYCAGAAAMIGLVWIAVTTMGGSVADVFEAIAGWADGRAGDISNPQ